MARTSTGHNNFEGTLGLASPLVHLTQRLGLLSLGLHLPTVLAKLHNIQDHAPRSGRIAPILLQLLKTFDNHRNACVALGVGIQRGSGRSQQITSAIQLKLLRRVASGGHDEVLQDLDHNLRSKQTANVHIANEMHNCSQTLALALNLNFQASRVLFEAFKLLVRRHDSAGERLILFLGGVQQDSGHGLSLLRLIRPGEIRVLVGKNSNHITVGGGVVRLIHGLAQNDLDHQGHLASAIQLNLTHLPSDGIQVLGRNLVQQRPYLPLKLLFAALRGSNLVGSRRRLRHLGGGSRAPSGLATGVGP
mmetsp:Transcript_46096/g.105178  ORF Transcript_46096/g.105178 Transcript_46096/m.105178 type:complete len:305 (-) Transcript_46096:816-1730(-)